MENDEETQKCDNCKNIFPKDKIDLHEAYCFRNIKQCKLCSKMIDINDQENHQNEFHNNKICQLCKQQFSPQLFQIHPQTCPRKLKHCEYCQNDYAQIQILKHKEACGARTRPCTICNRLIMIKDHEGHESRCQRRRQERVQVSQDNARNHNNHRIQNNAHQNPSRQRQVRQISQQNPRQIRSTSNNNKININISNKPNKIKPSHMIGPEMITQMIDPVPISVRLAMKNKQRMDKERPPLKNKN